MPGYATARVLLARAYERLSEWEPALRAWRDAQQIIPNSPVVRRGLERAVRKASVRTPDSSRWKGPAPPPVPMEEAPPSHRHVDKSDPSLPPFDESEPSLPPFDESEPSLPPLDVSEPSLTPIYEKEPSLPPKADKAPLLPLEEEHETSYP